MNEEALIDRLGTDEGMPGQAGQVLVRLNDAIVRAPVRANCPTAIACMWRRGIELPPRSGGLRRAEIEMDEAIVDRKSVTKIYQRGREPIEVLEDLDLQIDPGAFAALLGPSGSGKTTLFNLIGGLDQPTAGEIRVGGKRIEGLGSRPLAQWRSNHVGLVSVLQPDAGPDRPAERGTAAAAQEDVDQGTKRPRAPALEIVGLSDRARHLPRELSGGQEQRVAIVRAIVADPEILLADEATGDLDRDTAGEILSLLQTLNARHGKTILMVTHDPAAAECAGRMVRMDKGRLLEEVS